MSELAENVLPFTPPRKEAEPLLREVIGEILRAERREQHRTLREVADDAGVSLPYLSEIERGSKEASSEFVAAIGQALGLRLSEITIRAAGRLAAYDATNFAGALVLAA